mgnify:CR=1 FL=1
MQFPGNYGSAVPSFAGVPRGGLDVIIKIVGTIVELSLVLAILLAFIYLLIGGIKWITSQGDKQGLANAKSTVTYAIIGLIMAFLSFAILGFISNFFQVDLGVGFTHTGSYIPKGIFKN